jgi:3-methyladenine DNA glycosylase AlkC
MPEPLKNIINRELLQTAAGAIQHVWSSFDNEAFYLKVFDHGWEERALKERLTHVATVLRDALPFQYSDALKVISDACGHLISENGESLHFEYGFWPEFAAIYGLQEPQKSLDALETITRWTTAEYAIRPFLKAHPEMTYAKMHNWAEHQSPMVRRLCSEGFRPRLPWGMGLPALKKDPAPILPVLEKLKSDPAETVRRSVANCLNDISKDHPQLALDISGKWLGNSPETDWVVRHACRGLLKKGHPEALELFGFSISADHIKLTKFDVKHTVQIGEKLHFEITVQNQGEQPTDIRLEYRITYQKANGKTSDKVFHLRETSLKPGEILEVSRTQSFKDMTTRKHYPGEHKLGVLVNGNVSGEKSFFLN